MASAYLYRTNGTPTDGQKMTFSTWLKLGDMVLQQSIFGSLTGGGVYTQIKFMKGDDTANHGNRLRVEATSVESNAMDLKTTRLFRDPGAWYHLVVAFDTTQAVAADRCKIYVNGVQETDFDTETYPTQNDTLDFSKSATVAQVMSYNNTEHWTGCLAHTHFIDGLQYAASDFGETDSTSGIWVAKTSPSVTYGDQGFFLKYQDTSNYGDDSSGNTNDLTMSGTITQTKDTPDNNFCTMNPLDNYFNDASFSNGNNTVYTDGGAVYTYNTATYHLSTGKWYWEVKVAAGTNGAGTSYEVGIADNVSAATSEELGHEVTQLAYYGAGHIRTGNANTGTYSTYTAGDIVGVYLDLDNNKLYFAKNGTLENSGTGVDITAPSSLSYGGYYPAACYFDGDGSANAAYFYHNFGNGYFGTTAVTSGVADAGGEGTFEYDPSSGTFDGSSKDFRALCIANLATYG